MLYPDYTKIEDLSEERLERLIAGEPLEDTEEAELSVLFLQLTDFARTVTDGGSWPTERVHIMNWRTDNIKARIRAAAFGRKPSNEEDR